MKKKIFSEFKSKDPQEVEKGIKQLVREIIESKLELKMGKAKDVHLSKKKKKDLARLKTILKLKSYEHNKLQKESQNAAD